MTLSLVIEEIRHRKILRIKEIFHLVYLWDCGIRTLNLILITCSRCPPLQVQPVREVLHPEVLVGVALPEGSRSGPQLSVQAAQIEGNDNWLDMTVLLFEIKLLN